jgi:uncharacterized HAD superfamily protein
VRIGLDLDGVIVNSVPRWIEVLNREAGTRFGPDDYPDAYQNPTLAAVSDYYELELLIAPRPVPGAPEAVSALRRAGHHLVVVTARTPRVRKLTEAWLDYYGIHADRLHFLEGGSKVPVIRAEGLDVLVEDAPHNALAVAGAGIPVLLFDAPYNRAVHHPLIQRCRGWDEVLAQIEALGERAAYGT